MNNTSIIEEKKVLNRMNYLRGLFAILIVIGHCSMKFEKELLPLLIIHKSNMVSVCFFFIMSGWSLSHNYEIKKDYLKGFLVNKALKLFVFAFICEVLFKVLKYLIFRENDFNESLLLGYNWYVYEMIVFYFLFYVLYKMKIENNIRVFLVWVMSFGISLFFLFLSNRKSSFPHAYHFSSLCFAWGITIHELKKIIKPLFERKRIIIVTIILLAISAISCVSLKLPNGSFWGGLILHNLVGIGLISILALWANYIDYCKIPFVSILTRYSTEIYLYQFMVLDITYRLFVLFYKINLLYVVIVLAITLVFSFFMHWVNDAISKLLINFQKKIFKT